MTTNIQAKCYLKVSLSLPLWIAASTFQQKLFRKKKILCSALGINTAGLQRLLIYNENPCRSPVNTHPLRFCSMHAIYTIAHYNSPSVNPLSWPQVEGEKFFCTEHWGSLEESLFATVWLGLPQSQDLQPSGAPSHGWPLVKQCPGQARISCLSKMLIDWG